MREELHDSPERQAAPVGQTTTSSTLAKGNVREANPNPAKEAQGEQAAKGHGVESECSSAREGKGGGGGGAARTHFGDEHCEEAGARTAEEPAS